MSLSAESYIAIAGILITLPPTIFAVWSCINHRFIRRRPSWHSYPRHETYGIACPQSVLNKYGAKDGLTLSGDESLMRLVYHHPVNARAAVLATIADLLPALVLQARLAVLHGTAHPPNGPGGAVPMRSQTSSAFYSASYVENGFV